MKKLTPINFRSLTADPSSPSNGDLWYRSDLDQVRFRSSGSTFVLGPDLLQIPLQRPGLCSPFVGLAQLPVPFDCVYEGVVQRLATAPTGATTFKTDINYDGTTIFATTHTNQPTWTAGANLATVGAPSVTTFVAGHYWSWDIDAVGSTVPGSDLAGWLLVRRS